MAASLGRVAARAGAGAPVITTFTTRAGGVSRAPYDGLNLGAHVGDDPGAVVENRRRLAVDVGIAADRFVWMEQVHGAGVAVVSEPRTTPVPHVDALVTATPGLLLAVLVADCAPVLIRSAGVVAAVHAGRRGLTARVVDATLDVMCALGADRADCSATIGPCICACCYEVPTALRSEVAAVAPAAAARSRAGTPALDLRAGLAAALRAGGVSRVRIDGRCPAEEPDLFSYRRDGLTGRFAGVVGLPR